MSLAGIALIVLAMILYLAEIKIQSHGILGIGGTAALILGGLLLFDTSTPTILKVSWPVLIVAGVDRARVLRLGDRQGGPVACAVPMPRARRVSWGPPAW